VLKVSTIGDEVVVVIVTILSSYKVNFSKFG
jgi:hypothetical protein